MDMKPVLSLSSSIELGRSLTRKANLSDGDKVCVFLVELERPSNAKGRTWRLNSLGFMCFCLH